MTVVLNFLMLFCAAMSLSMAYRLHKRAVELRKMTEMMRKFERLYTEMAQQLNNISIAIELNDEEGVKIFFGKLHALHKKFMAIGKEDERVKSSVSP